MYYPIEFDYDLDIFPEEVKITADSDVYRDGSISLRNLKVFTQDYEDVTFNISEKELSKIIVMAREKAADSYSYEEEMLQMSDRAYDESID